MIYSFPIFFFFFFADDNLVFYRESLENCGRLKSIFDYYSVALGQIFYYNKSFILFSPNLAQNVRSKITALFDLVEVPNYE